MRQKAKWLTTLFFVFCCTPQMATAQGPLSFSVVVAIAPSRIGADDVSIVAPDITWQGGKGVFVSLKPIAGGPSQGFSLSLSDAQAVATGITNALTMKQTAFAPITIQGQTQPVTLQLLQIQNPNGFWIYAQPNGTWSVGYGNAAPSQVNRNWSPTEIRQFATYLSLGIAFANALP
jgi:hypothetical protein